MGRKGMEILVIIVKRIKGGMILCFGDDNGGGKGGR